MMGDRRILYARIVAVAAGVAVCPPAITAQERLGDEFQVNTYTTYAQDIASVAIDDDGNFIVVWYSETQDGSGDGIVGRRFAFDGTPLGDEFPVNTYTTSNQLRPTVAADGDGDFVVVWESSGQDGDFNGIFGQRFDSDGDPVGDEFQVSTYTTNSQTRASVARNDDGSFVVVWESYGQDGDSNGVFGQRFDSGGDSLGGEFPVNTHTTSFQNSPSVAPDADGNFVVAWHSPGHDGSSNAVVAQRFDDLGGTSGDEFQLNTYTTNAQSRPRVLSAAGGNFVAVWDSTGQDGDANGVFGRRFGADGEPLDGEFPVNTYTTSDQRAPSVAMDGEGNFVVVWESDGQDGDARGIFGQRYTHAGDPLGREFQINTHTTANQRFPSVAMTPDGLFVVVWRSHGQDGDSEGVFGQRFRFGEFDVFVGDDADADEDRDE